MSKLPHANASLMHEVRMIAMVAVPVLVPILKQLKFSHKEKTHIVGLTCATCLQVVNVGVPEPAITVVNGHAVCARHIPPMRASSTR